MTVCGNAHSGFGRHIKLVDHAIVGPLTGAEWRTLQRVHGRHHLHKTRRLRQAIEKATIAGRVSLFRHSDGHASLTGLLLHVAELLLGAI